MDEMTISTVLLIAGVSSIASSVGTVAVLRTEIKWIKDTQKQLLARIERLEQRT